MNHSDVLAALADSTLSVPGLAEKLPGNSPSDITEALSSLVRDGLVRSYQRSGITWYEATTPPKANPAVAFVRQQLEEARAETLQLRSEAHQTPDPDKLAIAAVRVKVAHAVANKLAEILQALEDMERQPDAVPLYVR